jgi:hypothetical protein
MMESDEGENVSPTDIVKLMDVLILICVQRSLYLFPKTDFLAENVHGFLSVFPGQ